MSTQVDPIAPADEHEDFEQYRALSTAAVASLLVGLMSCAAVLDWSLVAIPWIGVPLALFAIVKVRRNPGELTGGGVAKAGLALCLFFGVAGPARLIYEYTTEVPEGYERISYAQLQPDPASPRERIPASARELEGQRVFIKGFMYPGRTPDGIREFLLVRDQGDCCFGGDPKITDRIHVKVNGTKRVRFESRMHKVAGTFHVAPADKALDGAKGGVYYRLDADYVR